MSIFIPTTLSKQAYIYNTAYTPYYHLHYTKLSMLELKLHYFDFF